MPLLGFRCAKGDWSGALTILDNNLASGLIDKAAFRRQRGVLLTARALELEKVDRDKSRESAMEAIKLAPTLVPAAVLASKYQSEAHQIRRSMRIVETAWLAQPHPDLADAYAHVKLGDSARQRLVRIETLAAKAPGHIESALAIARAAIDAARIRARAGGAGAVHRRADPARGAADGGNRTHRARRQRPGAGLDLARGARARTIRCGPRMAMSAIAGGRCRRYRAGSMRSSGRRRWRPCRPTAAPRSKPSPWKRRCWRRRAASSRRNDLSAEVTAEGGRRPRRRTIPRRRLPTAEPACLGGAGTGAEPAAATAAGRTRGPGARAAVPRPPGHPQDHPASIPQVIPIVRAPDDPGIDDDPAGEEFREQLSPTQSQAGGWRGFLSRWGS